jgi:hypothetical protein
MVKPIEFDDVFGYDDMGHPCAVQLHGNVYAFGYAFCAHLKPLLGAGQSVAHRLFADGNAAFVFVFDPAAKTVDLWTGRWNEDDPKTYAIVDPVRQGFIDRTFPDFASVLAFAAKSEMEPIALRK